MTWLFTAILGIRKALQALWAIAMRYPMQAAIIGLACLSAWLWTGWDKADARADKYAAAIQTERAAYTKAQNEANARAIAAVKAQEARYKEQANNADRSYKEALADANSALDRYIATNRVRRAGTADSSPGGTTASPQGDAAESGDGPGATSFMVAVTPDDLRICTVNTERLIAVKAWADGLP